MIKRKIGSICRVGEGPTGVYSFLALSADAERLPTSGIATGSCCVMQDTGDLYVYHEDNGWQIVPFAGGGSPTPEPDPRLEQIVGRTVTELDLTGLETIGNYAFAQWSGLQSVVWPDVKTIGNGAFTRDASLIITSWPPRIETIRRGAFSEMVHIACTDAPPIATLAESMFQGATFDARAFRLNGPFTAIPEYCMRSADVEEIEIGGTVKRIEYGAFAGSYAQTIRITSKPDAINAYAFQDCADLADIYVSWSEGEVTGAPWGAANATIHYNTAF